MGDKDINDIVFHGNVQALFDLNLVNRGAYGYDTDLFGVKNSNNPQYSNYENRDNLIEFIKNIKDDTGNEVMVKNRIGPEFIKGFVVSNEYDKNFLMAKLRENGLVEKEDGIEYVIGKDIPLEDFIHIGNHFKQKMWE